MANTVKNFAGITTTSDVAVYTCPAATKAVVTGLFVTNVDSSAFTFTLKFTDDSAGTTYTILNAINIPGNTTINIAEEAKLVLEAADSIKIASNTASKFHVTGAVSEFA